MLGEELAEFQIALPNMNAVAVLLLLEKREQSSREERQVFLDVRDEHVPHGGPGLDLLELRVERRQDDGRFAVGLAQRDLELPMRVQRIDGDGDCAGRPGAEQSDDRLRRIRKEKRDAISFPDAEGLKR